MKIRLYTLITFLLISGITFAQNGTKNFIDQPYIEVTGESEMEITPDKIYVRIILDESDKKGRISIEKQENQMLAKLRNCDIDIDEQLTVEDFDGFYKRKFLGTNELTKTKRYQLLVYDGKTLAKVYHELDKIDISNISIIKIDHSKIEDFKRDNKLKALKTAKQKANDYAEAIDQSLGKAIYIQEVKQYNNYRYDSAELQEVVITGYSKSREPQLSNLNFKSIILKSSVVTRFILN